jgi:glycosyltransferase involved in cell wall biosynthesis
MSRRLALLAAFPFPLPQGSQVYVAQQARALALAGADVTLLCYGRGAPDAGEIAALQRAGVRLRCAPSALSRTPLAAGPSLRKPLADAALLGTLLKAQRRQRFDAVLAHHVEAACVGFAARSLGGAPVIYVAHTLLAHELPSYAPPRLAKVARRFGRALDRFVARRADASITLSSAAETALRAHGAGPVTRIRPGLDAATPPSAAAVALACARVGLVPGRFTAYAGNLDAYQDLALLAAAAPGEAPVVALTHDPLRSTPPGLRRVHVRDAAQARTLLFGAAAAVVPRRIVGGFPIKLLNYMEAERAIVAFADVAEGFTHDVDAWLLPREAGAAALRAALGTLLARTALSQRLGAAARGLLAARFRPEESAARTLALIDAVLDGQRRSRAGSLALRIPGVS